MADLTTLEMVQTFLGDDDAGEAPLLSSLITSESARFEGLAGGGPIVNVTVTDETFNGLGNAVYFPLKSPLVSVSALSVDGVAIAARPSVTESGYVLDGNAVRLIGSTFTKGYRNCSISYVAGYGATAPADVQQAVAEMVVAKYKAKDRANLAGAAMAGESVTYVTDMMSEAVRTVLDRYRQVRF